MNDSEWIPIYRVHFSFGPFLFAGWSDGWIKQAHKGISSANRSPISVFTLLKQANQQLYRHFAVYLSILVRNFSTNTGTKGSNIAYDWCTSVINRQKMKNCEQPLAANSSHFYELAKFHEEEEKQ